MRFQPYHPSFFNVAVTFQLATNTTGARGGDVPSHPTSAVINAMIEPDSDRPTREDQGHGQPITRRRWKVFTATDPQLQVTGFGLDDQCVAGGRIFKALEPPLDTDFQGVLWLTRCEELDPS